MPSCGAWLGASTAAKSGKLGTADYAIGLNEYEAVAQNTPDILHFYKNGARASSRAPARSTMAERAGQAAEPAVLQLEAGHRSSWRQIANGGADSAIATVASGIKAYDHKIFLTIWHEPENDLGSAGSGYAAADYVAMYRYVVTELRSLGVTNAVFVMNYMGFYGWSDVVDSLWPGDDVRRLDRLRPVRLQRCTPTSALFLDTANKSWPGFYSWATNKAPGKPIMLAEWGFDLTKQPDSPAILDGARADHPARLPDAEGAGVLARPRRQLQRAHRPVDHAGLAYGQAYKRFANNAYFNQTSTSSAP